MSGWTYTPDEMLALTMALRDDLAEPAAFENTYPRNIGLARLIGSQYGSVDAAVSTWEQLVRERRVSRHWLVAWEAIRTVCADASSASCETDHALESATALVSRMASLWRILNEMVEFWSDGGAGQTDRQAADVPVAV